MRISALLHSLLAVALFLSAASAQGPSKLDGWAYHTDSRSLSPEWVDKSGQMLCDGDRKKAVIWQGGPVTLDIDLGKPTRLTAVVAYLSRPNSNYNLRALHVSADVLGHFQEVGTAAGFWGDVTQREFRLEVNKLDVTTSKLRLFFDSPNVLCLPEVELYGEPAPTASAGSLRLAPLPGTRATAREADVDGDGKPEVVLENGLVRLVFWPGIGGICRSFLYKPAGCELVAPRGAEYGLLRDNLWSPAYSFASRPYTWRTGGDGKSAWVELSTSGVGGMMGFTRLSKRVVLGEGSPIVRVHYRLLNDPSSQTDYVYGQWFHNFAGVPGGGNRYFDPTEEGVAEYDFDPRAAKGGGEVWHRNPARGWTAVCGANGAGLAMAMQYKYLECFYHWSGIGVPVATHEWRFNRIPLKSGEVLETDLALMPFQGLDRMDGVVDDVLGEVSLQPGQADPESAVVKLALASPLSKPATGVLRMRRLPDGPWQDAGKAEVKPGAAAEMKVRLGGLDAGSYVLNCQVLRDGKPLDDFERPFSRGGARAAYHRAPLEKRVGLAAEEAVSLPRHDLSDAVVTPHVPWARPLAGGPIKAVVLCDDQMAREVIELKERLDLDVTYVKFRTIAKSDDHAWLYCGDRSISTPEQAQKRLLEYVRKNRYDLFILAGFDWRAHFAAEVREAITRRVREGAGLIFIEPDGFKEGDELAPMMGIAKGRSMYAWGRWQRVGDSPLTAGLPWDIFPQTRFMEYARPPQGEVLAKLSNGAPLLVTNTLGKGRTVALTYDVLTHEMSYRGFSGLTPILSYRGEFLRDEFKRMGWHYWEGWYAWLARLATWAAGRDTGVRIASLEPLEGVGPGRGAAALPLRLEGGSGAYQVSVDWENRWSQPLRHEELPYTAGQGALSLPVPANLGPGVNLVNVIVRDAAGASVAWGQTSVKGDTPLAIRSVQPEKEIVLGERAGRQGQLYDRAFQPREPFRVKVTLAPPTPPTLGGLWGAAYRVRARLSDTHGRLLFEETRPVPAGAQEMSFEARPAELRSEGLEWEIALLGPAGQVDVEYARVICPWPRDWDRFRLTSWSGIYPWRSEYLYPSLAPLVEDLQDVAFHGSHEFGNGHVWRHYWYNVDWSDLGLLDNLGRGVPGFVDTQFAEKVAHYDNTKDKQYLVRTPCLSDPVWRAKVAAAMRAQATAAMQYGGAYDYCMGDEMSLTYYTRYFDFCFCPHCLTGFRKWLQARYGSLDALNRAWETRFANWDAVMPMTLEEVKSRDNAAPWCEFRDYMNDVVAGFYAMIERELQAVDPQARAGLSGTQEPRAGNGMDWWKNSQAFNYYHAYNTGWSNEMRRSFSAETGVQQSPYYAGYWQSGRTEEYNTFWCLLHDTNGLSAWMTPIFFYNDFTYSESGRDTLALCKEMKGGIWDLLRHARRLHDGIAIHYSQDSINAAQLLGKEEEANRVRDAWVKLVEDLGLQYNFVATPQIEAGALTHPKSNAQTYRVLILPDSFAISDKEKGEIEAFVRAGGTVIADANAGLMDGKCRRGRQGVLDELFGIRRGQPGGEGAVGVTVAMDGAPATELKLPVAEALTATTAKALGQPSGEGKTAAIFRNAVGKGSAWYLNLDLRPFDGERTFHSPTEKGLRSVLARALAGAGVKPPLPIELVSGRAPHIEVVRYQAGDLQFVGLLSDRGDGGEEIARIALPDNATVYDCRDGGVVRHKGELRATLAGGQARLYCLALRPLAAPALKLSTRAVKPGEEVRYTASLVGGTDTQKQLIRLTLIRPNGTGCTDYSRNLLLGGAGFEGSFRLALDDPKGTWRIIARDLCSGASSETAFSVQ